MGAYLVRRFLIAVPVLVIIAFAVFGMTYLIPGDPARVLAGEKATPEQYQAIRHQLYLDRPFFSQFGHWFTHALTGDLGLSVERHSSVTTAIGQALPITLSLALGAMVVTVVVGVPLGVAAGTRPGSRLDRAIAIGTSLGLALPDFFVALLLIAFLSVRHHWFPAISYVHLTDDPVQWAYHLVLPWIALGIGNASTLARQVRAAMADTMEQDYIRTAEAKGLSRRLIVFKHALKNASITPLTVLGIQFAYLLGGSVIIEVFFGLPGMGLFFYQGLISKDVPVIQGLTLLVAVTFIVMSIVVDAAYAFVNPKVRFG
ncbi:MAG TPA: ABC transporter permease [Mycobacteriales bacterium]|nr:ABC transporter permease [Mycobacteriales bacterium]